MSIEERIGYTFNNPRLLEEALTHPGRAETRDGNTFNYQRLEFLGDSVLGLAVAEILYRLYPAESEGSLAKRHAALVCSETLTQVARTLQLDRHLRMAMGERSGSSSLEDACEALLGAMYLDGGYDTARAFILRNWEPLALATSEPPKDAKTSLQEWAQAKGQRLPAYTVTQTTGPAHAPEFTVEASLESGETAQGKAASKRQAEQIAAKALLEILEAS